MLLSLKLRQLRAHLFERRCDVGSDGVHLLAKPEIVVEAPAEEHQGEEYQRGDRCRAARPAEAPLHQPLPGGRRPGQNRPVVEKPIEIRPRAPNDAYTILLDPSLTNSDFSWRSSTSLVEDMATAIDWYKRFSIHQTFTHLRLETAK